MSSGNGLLLDTSAVLWILRQEDRKFSKPALRALSRSEADFVVSVASVWEIVVKHHAGKLWGDEKVSSIINLIQSQRSWRILPLEIRHVRELNEIDRFSDHTDPFDRILIAQAQCDGLSIVTPDKQFSRYKVEVVW